MIFMYAFNIYFIFLLLKLTNSLFYEKSIYFNRTCFDNCIF
jgi:hypothetical protein